MSEKGICKMSQAVLQARSWANELIRRESRGPGDMSNAMRRLEARYGIPHRTFWELRYRAPSDIFVSVFLKLSAAYQQECERQMRMLNDEIAITKAKTGPFHPAVLEAEAVLGETQGSEELGKLPKAL